MRVHLVALPPALEGEGFALVVDVGPGRADDLPVRAGVLPVLLGGAEVGLGRLSVGVHAGLERDDGLGRVLLVELVIALVVHPSGRGHDVRVDRAEDLVVLALGELTAGERSVGRGAPGRDAVTVVPRADAPVTRRVVDLIHRLHPRAGELADVVFHGLPDILALKIVGLCGLVVPVLAPVLDDVGLVAVLDNQQVLHRDIVAGVFDNNHHLTGVLEVRVELTKLQAHVDYVFTEYNFTENVKMRFQAAHNLNRDARTRDRLSTTGISRTALSSESTTSTGSSFPITSLACRPLSESVFCRLGEWVDTRSHLLIPELLS